VSWNEIFWPFGDQAGAKKFAGSGIAISRGGVSPSCAAM
jgi:hypothetical protein